MRHAINNSSYIIGNSASICSAAAIVAARDVRLHLDRTPHYRTGKRLPKVEVPVVPGPVVSEVSVRGSLGERLATRCTTAEQPTAMWQTASFEMPAAAWATFVLNRTTSV